VVRDTTVCDVRGQDQTNTDLWLEKEERKQARWIGINLGIGLRRRKVFATFVKLSVELPHWWSLILLIGTV